ncbi:MAG TPA: hypothetical protein VLA41_11380 [Burkholderiales bacterium]|nr:hypothetical protein [Burkholderiales bacterium]
MDVHRRPVRERLCLVRQHAQPRVELAHRRRHVAGDDPVAPLDRRLIAEPGEIERTTLPRNAPLRRRVLRMDRAHARRLSREQRTHRVADADCAAHDRAGHDQAGAGNGEGAVDREAEVALVCPRPQRLRRRLQMRLQRGDAVTAEARERKHGRGTQSGRREQRGEQRLDFGHARVAHAIDLGERHRAL